MCVTSQFFLWKGLRNQRTMKQTVALSRGREPWSFFLRLVVWFGDINECSRSLICLMKLILRNASKDTKGSAYFSPPLAVTLPTRTNRCFNVSIIQPTMMIRETRAMKKKRGEWWGWKSERTTSFSECEDGFFGSSTGFKDSLTRYFFLLRPLWLHSCMSVKRLKREGGVRMPNSKRFFSIQLSLKALPEDGKSDSIV